jgi:adenylylsulfate kinase
LFAKDAKLLPDFFIPYLCNIQMSSHLQHIHPVFDHMLGREEKERLLKQRAKVFWMMGLSGSGKSTIGTAVEKELYKKGYLIQLLDGDNVRTGINNNLGFTNADRTENIRRIAEVSKLFLNCGVITINTFVSPTNAIRQLAKDIIGSADFVEIFVNCPIEVCETRDVKGLYKKARAGEIKDFTGITASFEAPANASLEVRTDKEPVDTSVKKVLNFILEKITY